MKRIAITLASMLAMASCVAPRQPAPSPTPAPAPTPTPRPAPPQIAAERYSGDWSVDPLTPAGDWRYSRSDRGSSAIFADGRGGRLLDITCTNGNISLARFGAVRSGNAELRIRTSFGERRLTADTLPNGSAYHASLGARDALWDQIAFSRGRFLVEATGMTPMIVAARPAIGRVIEDCRG